MASQSRPSSSSSSSSRNLFSDFTGRGGGDADSGSEVNDQACDGSTVDDLNTSIGLVDDREVEEDADDSHEESECEMSDEDEFVPYSDDSDTDSSDNDEPDHRPADPEPDLDTSFTAESVVRGDVVRTRVYPSKDGTEWNSTPMASNSQTPASNVVILPRNRIPHTQAATTPSDIFELIISPDIIRLIVRYTNEEGRRQKGAAWKLTDTIEIKGLIGILLFLGAQKQRDVSLVTVWKPHIGQDFVRATMSKNRCFQLLQCLRFDQKETRRRRMEDDKLAPISEVLDIYSANLERYCQFFISILSDIASVNNIMNKTHL